MKSIEDIARHFREDVCLFDRSSEGKLKVFGPESARFLHNLCTNDIVGLAVGSGCLAYFCDRLAKVQGQARVYRLSEDQFWLNVPASTDEAMLKHLDKHLISEQVEFGNVTAEYCQFHLAGPQALPTLSRMTSIPIPPLKEYQLAYALEHDWSIRRNDLLGSEGYDLIVPLSACAELKERLNIEIASDTAFEMLRIEAVTPIFGSDIDEKRFVMELSDATKAVSYAKGCYLGQEPIVMARDRAGFVNRAMKLVKSVDHRPIPNKANLLRDGKIVGNTTSSTTASTKYGTTIALAYIQRGNQEPGTVLQVDGPTEKIHIEVAN